MRFQSYVCSRCAPKAVWLGFKHSPVQLESHESLEESSDNKDSANKQTKTPIRRQTLRREARYNQNGWTNQQTVTWEPQARWEMHENKQTNIQNFQQTSGFSALFLCAESPNNNNSQFFFLACSFHICKLRSAKRNVEKRRREWWRREERCGGAGVNEGKGRARRRSEGERPS